MKKIIVLILAVVTGIVLIGIAGQYGNRIHLGTGSVTAKMDPTAASTIIIGQWKDDDLMVDITRDYVYLPGHDRVKYSILESREDAVVRGGDTVAVKITGRLVIGPKNSGTVYGFTLTSFPEMGRWYLSLVSSKNAIARRDGTIDGDFYRRMRAPERRANGCETIMDILLQGKKPIVKFNGKIINI